MIEVSTIFSVVLATTALVFLKHKISEFLVSGSVVLLLLPVLSRFPSSVSGCILIMVITFEVVSLNSELWRRKSFQEISLSRGKLFLIGLFLTIGVTAILWWWQDNSLQLEKLHLEKESWWKLLFTLFMAFHLITYAKKVRAKR